MSWINWLLFESSAALGLILGLVCFGLLVRWRRGGSASPLLIALALSAVLLIAQALVVTHRERAGAILDTIARELVAGRSDALRQALAPQFTAGRYRGEELGANAFVEYVDEMLREVDVLSATRTSIEIDSAGSSRFTAAAGYLSEVSTGELRTAFRSRWQLTFERGADRWLISAIAPESVDGVNDATWDRIRR